MLTVSTSREPLVDVSARLAIVTTELGIGGAEKCAVMLACGMRQFGIAAQCISLAPRPASGQDRLVRQLENSHVPVHFLGATGPQNAFRTARRLQRILRQFEPDVVQAFLFHANMATAWVARKAGVSRLFAGLRVAEPVAGRWRLLRWGSGRFERFVSVSQAVADYAVQQGLPADKVCVIPNAVDFESLSACEPADLTHLTGNTDRRFLLCVARFAKQKGVDWLLRQADLLLRELPDYDLILVGTGPLLGPSRHFVQDKSWRDRVHFLGHRNDVPELMKACDLVLLPSRWEGMPNVLLEAMACGRAVLAHPVEGVGEVLGPLAEDQTLPSQQREEFVKKAVHLCLQPSVASSLGQANQLRVEQHFSSQHLCTAYSRMYLTSDQC